MNSISPVLLIMSCKAYAHKAQKQTDTWLHGITIPYYHVVGDPDLNIPFKFEEHLLTVKCKDDYVSLPSKVVAAFDAIDKTFEYSHVYKTDDDQMLTDTNFFEWLQIKLSSTKYHYGGNVLKIKKHRSTYYMHHPELPTNIILQATTYCNGRFYFLSRDAIKCIISKRIAISGEYFEDYAVGFHLSPIFKRATLSFQNGKYFKDF